MALPGAGLHKPGEAEMGAEELHDLQLLRRRQEVSAGPSSRMQPLLIEQNQAQFMHQSVIFFCI